MSETAGNFFRDNDDLLFQIRHGIRWNELLPLVEPDFADPEGPHSQEEALAFYEGALDAVGHFAAREIAPQERRIDKEEPRLVDGEVVFPPFLASIFEGMRDLGLYGLSIPRPLGGSNAPLALSFVTEELLARADISVMTHFGFHAGVASALSLLATREENPSRFDPIIRSIARGEAMGCMVLTEPGAGSDLAVLTTTARETNGGWRLNGEKIFITSGQAQWHLVLARSESADQPARAGLSGLSLFLVPRIVERSGARHVNVQITKLEEKLGGHGSPTCALLYEESEGELVGSRGNGFEAMLTLMNAARISVGFEAIGNSEAALRLAQSYAAERVTMGRPIAQHELIAEKLEGMALWVQALRALAIEATNAAELALRLPMGIRRQQFARKARQLTPLLKYRGAEEAVTIARDALQILGGMGYIDETGAHKKLRDAMVFPIYEGTSQIQALMATKDQLLEAAREPADFVRRLARARYLARRSPSPLRRELYWAQSLALGATETLLLRILGAKVRTEFRNKMRPLAIARLGELRELAHFLARDFLRRWDLRNDFAPALLHAERLTRILADVACARILVRQAEQFPERTSLAERFLHAMSFRVEAEHQRIDRDDGALLARLARETEGPTSLAR